MYWRDLARFLMYRGPDQVLGMLGEPDQVLGILEGDMVRSWVYWGNLAAF